MVHCSMNGVASPPMTQELRQQQDRNVRQFFCCCKAVVLNVKNVSVTCVCGGKGEMETDTPRSCNE